MKWTKNRRAWAVVSAMVVLSAIMYVHAENSHMNPFEGENVYTNPESTVCSELASNESLTDEEEGLLRTMCDAPKAVWLEDAQTDVESHVRNTMADARSTGELPVFVAYNIPQRDAYTGFSAGGAESAEEYLEWIQAVRRGVGNSKAIIVLEPDALAGLDGLDEEDQQERLDTLREAVTILKERPNVSVYIDSGHAFWRSPAIMAMHLKRAGIDMADGFALNVSNFVTTRDNIEYGEAVARLTNGAHFIIDSSRNGVGQMSDLAWCNPSGRALGRLGYVPEHSLADWVGWIKIPGESDGQCNGGPPAGTFWLEYALDLAKRAEEHDTLN